MGYKWMTTREGQDFLDWLSDNARDPPFRKNVMNLVRFIHVYRLTEHQFELLLKSLESVQEEV